MTGTSMMRRMSDLPMRSAMMPDIAVPMKPNTPVVTDSRKPI